MKKKTKLPFFINIAKNMQKISLSYKNKVFTNYHITIKFIVYWKHKYIKYENDINALDCLHLP